MHDLMSSPHRTTLGAGGHLTGVFSVFHGTAPKKAVYIATSGFANIHPHDGDRGYFGSGVYATLQADYAAQYASGELGAPVCSLSYSYSCMI